MEEAEEAVEEAVEEAAAEADDSAALHDVQQRLGVNVVALVRDPKLNPRKE